RTASIEDKRPGRRHRTRYRSWGWHACAGRRQMDLAAWRRRPFDVAAGYASGKRSEERRVGKKWRSRWSPYHLKKKKSLIFQNGIGGGIFLVHELGTNMMLRF